MTKEEMIALLAKRIAPKRRKELVWSSVAAAFGGMVPAEKADILAAIKSGQEATLGGLIISLVNTKVSAEALAEAQVMLENNSLSLVELERVL
jgi:hypothetical protein